MSRRELGRWGEEAVARYLQARGYAIVAENYTTRWGEVDLIAEGFGFLVFVEVKLRKNQNFMQARESVSFYKQRRLKTSAELYLSEHSSYLQPRFDVAEVYAPSGIKTHQPKIYYLENAFS
ncbi:MAG: YraN family protein [Oscillospiraceae bacterium]|nr:YraN family protein [Oscillospiraceae bacterium]